MHQKFEANSDYTEKDFQLIKKIDRYDLIYLEQPLYHDDIIYHIISFYKHGFFIEFLWFWEIFYYLGEIFLHWKMRLNTGHILWWY